MLVCLQYCGHMFSLTDMESGHLLDEALFQCMFVSLLFFLSYKGFSGMSVTAVCCRSLGLSSFALEKMGMAG